MRDAHAVERWHGALEGAHLTQHAADAVERVAGRLNRERAGPPLAIDILNLPANAFTLPGNKIYLAADLAKGIDALTAFVIAHEMAHHDLGHVGEPQAEVDVRTVRTLIDRGAYTMAEEIEADRLALELCRRAGFSEAGPREAFAILEGTERELRRRRRERGAEPETAIDVLVESFAIARPGASLAVRRRALWAESRPGGFLPSRYGLSATHMIFACARCSARFPPQALCPRCESPNVHSLANPVARSQVLAGAFSPPSTIGNPWFPAAIAACIMFAVLGAGPAIVATALVTLGSLGRVKHARPLTWLRPVPAAPPLPAGKTQRVSGIVRLVHASTSPFGTSCAVWQVRGEGPIGVLDDAGVGAFDIVDIADGGRLVGRVECDDALVDLGRTHPWRFRDVDAGLADFLEVRGGFASIVRVAETVLRDGDRVEVCGLVDDEFLLQGPRGRDMVPRFRDWPSIRRG